MKYSCLSCTTVKQIWRGADWCAHCLLCLWPGSGFGSAVGLAAPIGSFFTPINCVTSTLFMWSVKCLSKNLQLIWFPLINFWYSKYGAMLRAWTSQSMQLVQPKQTLHEKTGETTYIVLNESLEAIVDANDAIAKVEWEANKGAACCVHPTCRGSHVEDREVEGELHHNDTPQVPRKFLRLLFIHLKIGIYLENVQWCYVWIVLELK